MLDDADADISKCIHRLSYLKHTYQAGVTYEVDLNLNIENFW